MEKTKADQPRPKILAPAGGKASFLAAVAAGADAIYCGLKHFSARMEAQNFSMAELSELTALAHKQGIGVYVAINSLIKPDEMERAGELLAQLTARVGPDALIIQDLALVELAKQVGFKGELHLSTLANAGFGDALKLLQKGFGISRVVVPRELSIDEVKSLAEVCPPGLSLEIFIHGALCYAVSGRCYWSSYMGGKSGLRGRCVQPCRRRYTTGDEAKRFFSCQDLSLDVLTKVIRPIAAIGTWKIEGRKKGPHYVYYTIKAYKLLRDHGDKRDAKKDALALLADALGRTGTHYNFLPQRPQAPVALSGQTGSGQMVGRLKGARPKLFLNPPKPLYPADVLRIGYEDGPAHSVFKLKAAIPKNGQFYLPTPIAAKQAKGTPVFLIDRREKALDKMLAELAKKMAPVSVSPASPVRFKLRRPALGKRSLVVEEINVFRKQRRRDTNETAAFWIDTEKPSSLPKGLTSKPWWWLPPVVWPGEAQAIATAVAGLEKKGARKFVLNAPWQAAFFANPKRVCLWAGPFCNLANPLAIASVAKLGFDGVIVSPELGHKDYLSLGAESPLPLGIVIAGNWPLCIARTLSEALAPEQPFTSPKQEQAFARRYGENYWLFPGWELDLRDKRRELQKAGYRMFCHLIEPWPRGIKKKKRPGIWNWQVGLK
jgi:U32 family peptidase